MSKNPYAPAQNDLPEILPIFPLRSALLLPHGALPLNIFEPRYIQMIDHAMASDRMIGIIQPNENTKNGVQTTGCAGKIIDFAETEDGRYGITLSGISRFDVREEISATTLYRQVHPDWTAYSSDILSADCLDIEREKLYPMLKQYFDMQGMSCSWDAVDVCGDQKLITMLCMICPFEEAEKQALLEAENCQSRATLFLDMLNMHVKSGCQTTSSRAH